MLVSRAVRDVSAPVVKRRIEMVRAALERQEGDGNSPVAC